MPICPRCGQPVSGDWVLLGKEFYHWACSIEQGLDVIRKRGVSLLIYKNVVSVGVGFKITNDVVKRDISLIFNVEKKVPEDELKDIDIIPKMIDGVETDVVETGIFTAPPPPAGLVKPRTKRYRPVKGGSSISHINSNITGTVGGGVKSGKKKFILSVNHANALINDAVPDDPIIQPSKEDGGSNDDIIGALEDFSIIDFGKGQINELDAALISPIRDKLVSESIINIGKIKDITLPDIGIEVQKSGRTTGTTTGHIIQLGVIAMVVYPGDRPAIFTNQILIKGSGARKFAAYGDGGALVVDPVTKRAIGMLFAGSYKRNYTLATPIKNIIEFFKIEI